MSASSLVAALASAGLPCTVDAFDSLAVLTLPDAAAVASLATADRRHLMVALAREHGFTHVALELRDNANDASLLRA